TSDPEQVAIHLLQVEPRSEQRTVEILRAAAAEAAARGAPDAAAMFLQRALGEPPEQGAVRAEVLVELGEAEARARLEGFEEHLSEAVTEFPDPERAAEIALTLARALSAPGDGERAFGIVEAAIDTVDPCGPMGLLLEAERLALAHAFGQLRPRVAERVRNHLERLERGEPVDAVVHGALAPLLLRAHPPAERAIQAAETALADERVTSQPLNTFVLAHAGYTLLGAGHAARAAEVFGSAIAAARRRGELLTLGWASALRSDVFYHQGEILKAEEDARVAWESALGEGMVLPSKPLALTVTAGVLVNALVARGELDEAERILESLPTPLPERVEMLLPARAELRLAQGRVEEAIADLHATGMLLGEEFHKPVQNWRARLAVTLARRGEQEEARALAAAELEQAQRWEVPQAIAVALTASGLAEGGQAGIALLEEAVAMLADTEGRLDHALALIELGALQRRSGFPARAREPLRAGMDLASRCGASLHADRAHAELVAAGGRPRRDRRFLTGPESLTAGELRVAALAAEGLTDRAIAQRLYVTQAAVQFHLRNTFRKLDIRARSELATHLGPSVVGTKP
ncbi:MAG TPA: LuxR C-terminal-related transcriptional regulator, partial [Solirubrobacteraceae bacterium]|nr:LuxR C-terminal-related transcriptional regulator [Solirubrobacteraceae bacterium]